MTRTLLAVLGAGLMIAACGGQSSMSNSSGSSAGSGAVTVKAMSTKLGMILVDGHDRTLYLFEKDKSSTSTCSGACAGLWPPLTSSSEPQAGASVNASLLKTAARPGGGSQVTYDGHPLYYYAPDGSMSGSLKGEGLNQFGAGWYVVNPSGMKVEEAGS